MPQIKSNENIENSINELSPAEIVRQNVNCNYFISASAGTGKTYTLTSYYIGILEYWEKFNKPDIVDNILAVTFTNKAANEMKSRIMNEVHKKIEATQSEYWKNVYSNISRAIISTIDSLCRRLLVEQNVLAGVDPNFSIINELKQIKIIENVSRYVIELAFQVYEDMDIRFRPNIPVERRKRLENYLSEIKKCKKEYILELFERVGSIETLKTYISNVVRNWRLELNFSRISDQLLNILEKAGVSMHIFRNMCLIAAELYEAETLDNFEYDFKGVLEKVLSVLENEQVRRQYQERFKYIIVDEFQDTNELQRNLFEKLHNDENYVFYVGDRKQSIYRFRGADVSVFIKTMNKFEEMKSISSEKSEKYAILSLQKNFRSHKHLVNYFNEISEKAIFNKYITESKVTKDDINDDKSTRTFHYEVFRERYPQFYNKLFFIEEDFSYPSNHGSENEILPSLDYLNYELDYKKKNEENNEENNQNNQKAPLKRVTYLNITEKLNDNILDEALVVAQTIKDIVGKEMTFYEKHGGIVNPITRKIEYKDIAILTYRLSNIESIYREIFAKFDIPMYVVKGRSFYRKPEIRAIVSALNVIQNPDNNYNFMEFFFTPFFEEDQIVEHFNRFKIFNEIVKCARELKEKNNSYSLYQAAKSLASKKLLPEHISNIISLIEKYDELKYFLRPAEVLKNFIKESNYLSKLSKFEGVDQRLKNVKKLLDQSMDFNQYATSFLELTRLFDKISELQETEASEISEESNVVRLMTIHASKGLEFNIVFLVQNNFSEREDEDVIFPIDEEGVGRYIHIKKFLDKFKDEISTESDEYAELIKQLEAEIVFDETELLRKMYVGVTRAKEMLFIVTLPQGKRNSHQTAKEVFERMQIDNDYKNIAQVINIDKTLLKSISQKLSGTSITQFTEKVELNEEIIKQQISDFSHIAYKRYISPMLLLNIQDEKSHLEDPQVIESMDDFESTEIAEIEHKKNIQAENKVSILLDNSLEILEGKLIHKRLMTVDKYNQLIYLAEQKKIPMGILKSEVLKWLFDCDKVISEFRLAKYFELDNKNYVLFGVPDKVFFKNKKIYVADFKNTFLKEDSPEFEKYKFQIKFYMYLLKDFGEVGGGYLISTKTGWTLKVDVPDETFSKELIKRIKAFEDLKSL